MEELSFVKIESGLLKDHLLHLIESFGRRGLKCEKVYDVGRHTTETKWY